MKSALANFQTLPLKDAARRLLARLGYQSEKFIAGAGSSPQAFLDLFASGHAFDRAKALVSDWKSADLLFQLTDQELSRESSLFTDDSVQRGLLKSYVFIAIELKGSDYARGKFSAITRQINRLFPMPVMVLFKCGGDKNVRPTLTIAVINRRANKLDESKDVLGKVTIIREIDFAQPHRGHLDILASLALSELKHPQKKPITDFDTLHAAWEQIFNVELLNERFYRELANWYFWALPQVEFPADLEPDDEKRRATGLIRLLTRLIFCWFLKEKGLIPEKLFHPTDLAQILKGFDPESETSSTYYQAILQNLFFATLNQRMGKDGKGNPYRVFAKDEGFLKNRATYDVNNLYRYESLFREGPEAALAHFADIPFLNGGLFECLDRTEDGTDKKRYLDGFSRNAKKRPTVPNRLFFGNEHEEDLSGAYGDTKRRKEKVSGLIHILNRYKFTIVENTPIDQEIALDPELLGKVFENLLASYNEETKTTARKQTGSFYTPRPIVDYMVDESLKAHLTRALVEKAGMKEPDAGVGLDILFAYTEKEHAFIPAEVATLIAAIDALKVLDPACGSGAFPMGVLHKLVTILGKLDPDNQRWKATQLAKLDSAPMREQLEAAFADNADDYGRKLYLIENCLYGVDIQPIAIQITKLRFFISLVCDQKTNRNKKDNHGILPLPNLETKFVAADTLIGLPEMTQLLLVDPRVGLIEKEIESLYHSHFAIQRREQKLALQRKIKTLRQELARLLAESFMSPAKSKHVAEWDPFDPQSSADFFDPHWMFGTSLTKGFDVVIGNPPYVRIQMLAQADPKQPARMKEQYISASKGNYDLYVVFVERGLQLLQPHGQLSYILPHKFFNAQYGEPLRKLLADGKNLRHVVHFGDQQIFPGATNYVCLLFLDKGGADHCRWVRAGDLPAWLVSKLAPESSLPATRFTAAEWNFAGSTSDALLHKLRQSGIRLLDLPADMSRGHSTGDDDVFVVEATTTQVEPEILRIPVFASDFKRYSYILNSKWRVIFPYRERDGSMELMSEAELKREFPKAFHYLSENRAKLEQRKGARFWYGFTAPRNLNLHDKAQVFVPLLAESGRFALIPPELVGQLSPMASGGFTVSATSSPYRIEYLLGLLNSRLLFWMLLRTSNLFRGGWITCTKQYFGELPIRSIDFAVPAERAHHDAIVSLVDRILSAKRSCHAADTTAQEREIDQLVYALYGLTSEEITTIESPAK